MEAGFSRKCAVSEKPSCMVKLKGAVVEFALPAVITVDEGLNKERLPSLKGIMAAKKKPLDVKPAQLAEARVTVSRMELPPERGAGRAILTHMDHSMDYAGLLAELPDGVEPGYDGMEIIL